MHSVEKVFDFINFPNQCALYFLTKIQRCLRRYLRSYSPKFLLQIHRASKVQAIPNLRIERKKHTNSKVRNDPHQPIERSVLTTRGLAKSCESKRLDDDGNSLSTANTSCCNSVFSTGSLQFICKG